MQQYPNTGDGLKKMFIAAIGTIICGVVAIIPVIGAIIGGIGAIVFMVISLIGLNSVSKDIPACKMAFILTIVNLVVSALETILSQVSILSSILSIGSSILSLLVVYYVCIPVSGELNKIGASDVANSGQNVWKWNLVCYILVIVFTVIALIPVIGVIGTIGVAITAILSLVAEILYLIFINKSYHAFGA